METGRLTELVVKAQRGDADALQELYLDAFRSVFHFALRMVKNPEDAEDITQEVFITVHEKISGLREPAAFYKWLNQITANKCNDLLRKYKGIASLDDDEEILALIDDDPNNMPDKAIDDEDTRRIILGTIDALPDGQRACVLLYYYQQCTIAQIADALELNENTVKTRLSLARAKIRAALEEKEKKEGIKLWGVPLALTPILKQAEQDFVMPEGAAERIWESVKGDISQGSPPGGNGNIPGSSGDFKSISDSGIGGTANAVINTGMALVTKITIGVVAVAVVTAGVFLLTRKTDSTPESLPTTATDVITPTKNEAQLEESSTSATETDELQEESEPLSSDNIGKTFTYIITDGYYAGTEISVFIVSETEADVSYVSPVPLRGSQHSCYLQFAIYDNSKSERWSFHVINLEDNISTESFYCSFPGSSYSGNIKDISEGVGATFSNIDYNAQGGIVQWRQSLPEGYSSFSYNMVSDVVGENWMYGDIWEHDLILD